MSDTKQTMSIPGAIVIAGILIAGAVYFSQVGPKEAPVLSNDALPSIAPSPRPASLDIRPITTSDHIRGGKNAKITILEYSDLECPFCRIFHNSMEQIVKEYPNDVRWVFRHAPILQLHPNANAMANVAECAAQQGKFWEFTDVVFAEPPTSGGKVLADLEKYAILAGIPDVAGLQKCVVANTFTEKVQADYEDGIKAGPELFGTPFNMIITQDGTKTQLGGGIPYAQLKAIIEPLL
ncbi:MAG: DsbA family protein [bacterium]|nr:DsbA family protein [bacterium]